MTATELIRRAIDATRMVQVAHRSYTVDIYSHYHCAWILGVPTNWHNARASLSANRVYIAAEILGYEPFDCDGFSTDFETWGGNWREFVRDMVKESKL